MDRMSDHPRPGKGSTYDLLPYRSHSFPQSHPDHLATLARLVGLEPQPVTASRVLELGCASGGNLIPLGHQLPGSEFTGVELSGHQAGLGRKAILDLGLKNVEIKHMDIMDIDETLGMFDFIIAHGVYSWVPREVQEHILDIASSNLSPHGVAYVSYNTYPGWHVREMIRHMMLYHSNRFDHFQTRVEQARAFMAFLADAVSGQNSSYEALLRQELDLILKSDDAYVFHEFLEEDNSPEYFHQFMERAQRHGLQYLAEADFHSSLTSSFPKNIRDKIEGLSQDIIESEQFMDFLRNRHFRQTLLCHCGLSLQRTLGAENLEGIKIASCADPENGSLDCSPGSLQTFRTPEGMWTSSESPATKAALTVLRRTWPQTLDFEALLNEVARFLGHETQNCPMALEEPRREDLAEDLLHCFAEKVIEFHTQGPHFVTRLNQRPKASPLAAYQAHHGLPIVNQRHETVVLEEMPREILKLMNGSRNLEAIVNILSDLAPFGVLHLDPQTAESVQSPRRLEALAWKSFRLLARNALLVA